MKIKLIGLTCPACKKISEKRIGQIPDITRVEVDLATGDTEIEADRTISVEEVNQALEGTNYTVQL